MSNLLKDLLGGETQRSLPFSPGSRYYMVHTSELETPDGRRVAFVRRRFVPPADRFTVLGEHRVMQGDRMDNLAAHYLGDPERFWQLCDANGVLHPEELTTPVGGTILITLPEGIPGPPNG